MARAGFAKDQLKSFIDRIERLNEEREALSADIREVFAEAKGTGFDTKIMRKVLAFRKLDRADFEEQEAMIDLYMTAVGFDSTPLARATTPAPKSQTPIPAGPQAGEHGLPDKTGAEASALPAHDRSGQGPEGITGVETPAPKADTVAGVSAPISVKVINGLPYPVHGFDIGDIPASLDRRERAPPQPSA